MSNEVKNKMYDLEIPPPAGMWEKIVSHLDVAEEDSRVAGKIGSLDITPPKDIWTAVSHALDTNQQTKSKTGGKLITLKRMAIAAAFIGILVLSVIWINNNSRTGEPVVKTIPQGIKQEQPAAAEKDTGSYVPAIGDETAEEKKLLVKTDAKISARKIRKPASVSPGVIASSRLQTEEKLHNASLVSIADAQAVNPVKEEDRYYNLLDENGNLVRVSRKLASMQCVIKNVSDIPFSNTDEEKQCLAKINEWRNKMATAPAFASPLDLIRVIASDQQ